MSELKLTDRNWGRFTIGDLFHIKIGKSIDGNKVNRESGKIAYITRKEQNNGLDGFIDYESDFLNNDYLVLTIGNETAEPFVQCYPFFTGTKVNILKPRQELSASVLSFVAVSLKQHKSKYSYSFTINSTRLKKQVILLPVNSDGLPDWQFMEDFTKQKEQKQIADLKDYYADKAVELMISTGSLKNTQWREFYIRDYFEFIRGNQNNMAKCKAGYIPLISAKKVDNGYKDFIASNNKSLFPKHILTLNNDGDGGVGIAYYQPVASALDTHVTALLPKIELSRHTLLFVARSITHQRDKFSHGYSLNNDRLRAQKILLPVNSDGLPDWRFMEDFMKQIERDKIAAVLSYYNNSLNNNSLRGGVEHWMPSENRWAAFAIQDICEIVSGQDIYERERITGNTPYITATANNNGIGYFISNQNTTLEKDCISVNRNGSVGYAFYHPYYALFGNDTRKLRPKYLNKYTSLFLTACIEKQRIKYGYGYKMGTERLKKQKILLPVDASNQPDWINIECFMQQMELEKIICYLKSKN